MYISSAESAWEELRPQTGGRVLRDISLIDHPLSQACDPSDVAAVVDMGLERRKDREDSSRIRLAGDVKYDLEGLLKRLFSGDAEEGGKAKAILYARVAIVSGGSSRRGKGGRAKLVVLWCLQDVETGDIVMGRRTCGRDSCMRGCVNLFDNGTKGEAAVKDMAVSVANEITLAVREKINSGGGD